MLALRVIAFVIGLWILYANREFLKEAWQYYTKPGSQELNFKLLKIRNTKVFTAIIVNFGIAFFLISVLPHGNIDSYNAYEPNDLSESVILYSFAAFAEEFLFRILPWILLFSIRKAAKRHHIVEVITILVAVVCSSVFGLLHVTNYINPNAWIYVGTSIQTSAGLIYWYLVEREGIFSSTLAHFLFNFTIWVIVNS